jgi:2-polyprenyl-3-methyl-5-hydroxy-6-metoxy-1,4-benzoquinol methylase
MSDNLNDTNRDVRASWNANAEFWDNYMGEGGSFQRALIGPATERLLELRAGESVLEVACGNGMFARRMAQLGGRVVACDFAEEFLECARARTTEHTERIEYCALDATDYDQLMALGKRRFDAAVCTMALMDMSAIDPLFKALSVLLKRDGRFVFSLTHPCLNSGKGCKKVIEETEGEAVETAYAIQISNYITPATYKGLGILGQPVPQYYFHRPLSVLFNSAFSAGFVLDGLEEPVFPNAAGARRPFSWENFREIPPVLVARVRLK